MTTRAFEQAVERLGGSVAALRQLKLDKMSDEVRSLSESLAEARAELADRDAFLRELRACAREVMAQTGEMRLLQANTIIGLLLQPADRDFKCKSAMCPNPVDEVDVRCSACRQEVGE